MRKKGIWALLIAIAVCCLGFAAYLFFSQRSTDKTPPEISFASDVLPVSVAATEAELMEGVTARDDRDGDVTGSIVIEGVTGPSSDQLATITYAAFDREGKISTVTIDPGEDALDRWRTQLSDTLRAQAVEGETDTWTYGESRIWMTEKGGKHVIVLEKSRD